VPNTREHVNPLYEPKTITGTYEPYGEKPTHTVIINIKYLCLTVRNVD